MRSYGFSRDAHSWLLARPIFILHTQQKNPESTKFWLNMKKCCLYCFILEYEEQEKPLVHKHQPDQKSHSSDASLTYGLHLLCGKQGDLAAASLGALAHPLAGASIRCFVNGRKPTPLGIAKPIILPFTSKVSIFCCYCIFFVWFGLYFFVLDSWIFLKKNERGRESEWMKIY